MEILYFILSVLIGISPRVRRFADLPVRANRSSGTASLVSLWLPMCGWVSVAVRCQPSAVWLKWQVIEIRSFGSLAFHDGSNLRKSRYIEHSQQQERLTLGVGKFRPIHAGTGSGPCRSAWRLRR